MSDIKEGNKLIATFMNHGGGEQDEYNNPLAPYNSSWNWLMPVVEKINEIEDQADEELFDDMLMEDLKILYHTSITCSIKVVYERVVEFIEWYNKTTLK